MAENSDTTSKKFAAVCGVHLPKVNRSDKAPLRKVINEGNFREEAASGNIDPMTLIGLSDEVEIARGDGARPVFDIVVSPDPLTMTIANRLHEPLHRMGFDPVLIFKDYKYPRSYLDIGLTEFSWQTQAFNDIILGNNPMTAYPEDQYLSPEQLRHAPTVKSVFQVSKLSEKDVRDYMSDPDKVVGVTATFRLYELIDEKLIRLFRNPDQDIVEELPEADATVGQVRKTHFRSKFNHTGKDDGTRQSMLVNLHPSLIDHGVIPPFWPMLRMLKFARQHGIEYEDRPAEEVAQEFIEKGCFEHGVDPYLNGMLHHIQREYDTGAVIIAGHNQTPIDLNKSVWENYFDMQDMIINTILASAAAYKMGLDTSGIRQDLTKSQYHSYPGVDSSPPSYFTPEQRRAIKLRDVKAMEEFRSLGGKICNWDHFLQITVEGNPENGAPGFVPKGSPAYTRMKNILVQENEFRRSRLLQRNLAQKAANGNPNPSPDRPNTGHEVSKIEPET